MAYLKKSRIDGNLTVEGSIKSKNLSSNLNEDSDKVLPFPSLTDINTISNRIVKFENDNAGLTESVVSEEIGKEENNYSLPLTSVNFSNKHLNETFDRITINKEISELKTIDSSVVLLYEGSPESGDLYIEEDGVTYSTNYQLNQSLRFKYINELTPYNESSLGGSWAGLKDMCNYLGTWPEGKKGLVVYNSLLLDNNGNSDLCWDQTYTSSKLGENGMTKIGDGIINTNTFIPLIGNKENTIFYWLNLFNNNQHPVMPNNTGFSDWFIPSYNEICFMLDSLKTPLDAVTYWTSGEHSSYDSAWTITADRQLSALGKSTLAKCIIARYF